ncbi:MAG: 16S rRNA (uracil(1498)-N(3))-methyltransferase [Candidatus Cyclobacteriaceae bacterium M3_2C_046]
MQLFYEPDIDQGQLNPEESHHAIKVLRKNPGDQIHLTDGKGNLYQAIITKIQGKICFFEVHSKEKKPGRPYFIHLAIAPTKNADRIEWFVEKSMELGIDAITFLDCEHSERKKLNINRISKKAVMAMKQSNQAYLPEINSEMAFNHWLTDDYKDYSRFIAFVDRDFTRHLFNQAQPGGKYLVLIGPEGDFSQTEIKLALEAGYKSISLGPTTLRTETAGIVACHTLHLLNQYIR